MALIAPTDPRIEIRVINRAHIDGLRWGGCCTACICICRSGWGLRLLIFCSLLRRPFYQTVSRSLTRGGCLLSVCNIPIVAVNINRLEYKYLIGYKKNLPICKFKSK